MNRTRGSVEFHGDPIATILADREKKALAAQILGQAYVTAVNFVAANRDSVEGIANAVIEKRELYGDELLELLEGAHLVKPEIDYLRDETWPSL
jgi:hypothetical protein